MARRLAAILVADVVGYSRLIGVDEAGTLAALRALRKDLVEPTLKRHRGRVVKLMGAGLLAEFASVVDAVAAAVEIQQATSERAAHLAEDRRIALRIGVNIGDVERIQFALSDPGGSDPGGYAMSVRNRRRRSFMRAIDRIDGFERNADQNQQGNRGAGSD